MLRVMVLVALAASIGACARSGERRALSPDAALPSWNDSAARRTLVEFVERTTTPGSPDFVAPAERIAVFDNDGTLWCEQPVYAQVAFAIDRIHAMAPDHPEWREQEPFRSILAGDSKAALGGGANAVTDLIMTTHAGMSVDEFDQLVVEWLKTARHPRFNRPYDRCVYLPMVELLEYVRSRGFKTYIVSGGGVEFMRAFAESAYGVPPEQVIGSTIATQFELRDGVPVITRLPRLEFLDDREAKAAAIQRVIGRRPILAVGNSDGDQAMLQWTTIGRSPSLGVIIHHTDAEREWAYDRGSHIGRLEDALDEAPVRGWLVVDMARDWAAVLP
jgi:phosphoserine phosphatase